ncbi:MAG: translation initiation factor IF-2 [Microgenomates group bacterium Gr01-1014_16]|nr:MAG: translation initiation factor IF-2 [Microgenomates group bacterium Gr01-1014_16]
MLQNRPPVVVILGHVDHGKTTLLDYLRKSNVAAREAGGITQHIRSFQLNGITFIDTPGHEAFVAMRSRGSKIADFAVLVVAADDGVMPQTKQSIEFIRQSGIPFLVAINKSDLPAADPDKVKTQLTEYGVVVEELGGDVPAIAISAKTGRGLPELLELLELLASMNPPQADPTGSLEAIVLESRLDPQKGPLATVIVKNGTLKIGHGIRALLNSDGQNITEALPSTPVEVLGLKTVPEVGSVLGANTVPSTQQPYSHKAIEPLLNIILRTDFAGSLEAIINSLPKEINILHSGTGNITESDVDLAKTSGAHIVGFNIKATSSVAKLAEVEKVPVHLHKIIYQLIDETVKLITKPVVDKVLGQADIIAEFSMNSDHVAGCRVTSGVINKSAKIRIVRTGLVSKIKSLKSGKSDVLSAKSGVEFGAVFSPSVDFKIGDAIIAFE